MNSSQRKALCTKARTVGLDRDDTIRLADELDLWVDLALKTEAALHDHVKKWEGKFKAL